MNKSSESHTEPAKTHHEILKIWLNLIIIFNVIAGLVSFFILSEVSPGWGQVSGILMAINVYGAYELLKWKKSGWWILLGTGIIAFGMNIFRETGPSSIFGLVGVLILYLLLTQLKVDGKNAWSQLEK